jgi:hypothetical protein
VHSAQQAINIALEGLRPLYASDPSAISAVHMTAADAARETKDMGLDELPLIQSPDYKPCEALSCPYPGEPANEPGYLVLVTETQLLNAPTNTESDVAATWVGDDSSLSGGVPALPMPAPQTDGSYVTIKPTDWGFLGTPQLDPSQTTFRISVAVGGGCDKFGRIDTTETSDAVSVRAFYRETTYPDTACTTELNHQQVDVHLETPLGDRKLEGCDGSPIGYDREPGPDGDCRTARS